MMIETVIESNKDNQKNSYQTQTKMIDSFSASCEKTQVSANKICNPPEEVLANPALLFLYYRIEQILGIKAGIDALIKLNEYLEKKCSSSFIKNPSSYDYLLTSREHIHKIAKFVTVNETYFFREGCHFEILSLFLPDFANTVCAKLKRPLQICCAAVSIGCEAYSIAMLIDYYIKKGMELDYSIDAFDIDAEVIETAKNARYTSNTFRSDTSAWKHIFDSYLIRDNDTYLVPQNIRRKVKFFPHNIMRGLDKQYDVIFFRNSLIYFSSKNRLSVINNLSDALYSKGLLFLGISETASIKHPLLANCFTQNVFYFQKIPQPSNSDLIRHDQIETVNIDKNEKTQGAFSELQKSQTATLKASTSYSEPQKSEVSGTVNKETGISIATYNAPLKETELLVNCCEIADILKIDEGKTNAQKVLDIIINKSYTETIFFDETINGSNIAAAVSCFLNTKDFNNANLILNYLEKYNSGAITAFLRAEYYYLRSEIEKAENLYQEVSVKNKYFWPAFYRIAIIASNGNITRFEYKIKKTIECIELLQKDMISNVNQNYECFMGGFSPDYFRRILEKKLSEKRGDL